MLLTLNPLGGSSLKTNKILLKIFSRWLQEKIGKPLPNAVYQKHPEMPKVPCTQAHLRWTNASGKVSFALVPVFLKSVAGIKFRDFQKSIHPSPCTYPELGCSSSSLSRLFQLVFQAVTETCPPDNFQGALLPDVGPRGGTDFPILDETLQFSTVRFISI